MANKDSIKKEVPILAFETIMLFCMIFNISLFSLQDTTTLPATCLRILDNLATGVFLWEILMACWIIGYVFMGLNGIEKVLHSIASVSYKINKHMLMICKKIFTIQNK